MGEQKTVAEAQQEHAKAAVKKSSEKESLEMDPTDYFTLLMEQDHR